MRVDPAGVDLGIQGFETTCAVSNREGTLLATGSDLGNVFLFDIHRSTTTTLRGHTDEIYSLALNPEERLLATASRDGTARLWDLSANDVASTAIILNPSAGPIYVVAFTPDGRWLLTGDSLGNIQRWHLRIDELIALARNVLGEK